MREKLRLLGSCEFDTDRPMKKPSLAFHCSVNQGGLPFLRQAKGNNLNLRKTIGDFQNFSDVSIEPLRALTRKRLTAVPFVPDTFYVSMTPFIPHSHL